MAEQGSRVPTFSDVFGLVRQSLTNKQSQNPTTLSVKPRILREEPSEQESEQESDSINNPFTDDSSDWEPQPSDEESSSQSDLDSTRITKKEERKLEPQPSDEESSSQSDLNSSRKTKQEERKLKSYPAKKPRSSQTDHDSKRKSKKRKWKSYPAKKPRSSQTDHDSKRKSKKRKWKSYPAKKPRSSQTDHDSKRKSKKRKWKSYPAKKPRSSQTDHDSKRKSKKRKWKSYPAKKPRSSQTDHDSKRKSKKRKWKSYPAKKPRSSQTDHDSKRKSKKRKWKSYPAKKPRSSQTDHDSKRKSKKRKWKSYPAKKPRSSQTDHDSKRKSKKRKWKSYPAKKPRSSQTDHDSKRKSKKRKWKSYPAKKPRSSQTDHDSKRKSKKRKWKSYPAKKPRSSQTDHDSKRKSKKRKWEPHPSGGHSSVGLLDLHSTRETKKDDTACESRNSYKQQSDDNYVSDSNSERSAVSVEYPALSTSQFDDVPPIGIQQKSKNWDKYHSCCFCNKMVIKIARHLEKKHVNETGVAQVLLLAKGSSARRKAWVKLMNDGDYQHNFEVLERGRGTIIPRYRRVDMDVQKIVPCPTCKGMYRRNKLATHSLGCRSGQKGRPYKEGSLMLPVPPNIPKSLWENVLLKMRDDEVATNAKKDDLIVAFGERIYNRRDVEEHTADHVSGRMRELSRLVLDMKRESGNQVCTLSDALQVKNFDDLIKSVRNIAQYSDETHTFKKGSLARKLGYSVQTCATILKSKAIQNSNKDGIENATNFLSLFSGNWTDHISAVAGQSLEREKFNKPRLLPCCKDVQKLYSFVKDVKTEDYPFLAKAAICEISLFNRKRGGEIQRMTLDDLEKGKANNGPADEEIMQSLTAIERKLVQTLKRIEIRGKFNRRVAILLTDSMMAKIDKIVNLREELSISSKYIFATPNGERPYRGSDAIRLLAVEAEVSNPEIFTWTALRKQVATISQAIEISDLEQDQLAQFLGHDIRVHRDFYRLPHDILQKAKVAKILLRINEGKNVSTKDLVVDENVELEPELDNSDNSDDEKDGFKEKNCGAHASKEVLEDNAEQSTKCRARKSASQRRKWNEDEKRAVLRHLSVFIGMKKVPGKSDIEKVLKKEKCLQSRTWTNIKDYCYNEIKKM